MGLGVDSRSLIATDSIISDGITMESTPVRVFTNYCSASPEYKLLKRLIKQTEGWSESKIQDANVVWLSAVQAEGMTEGELYGLRKRKCWFSRYMGSREVCSKRTFFGTLNCAKRIFPDKLNKFLPKTWFFPEEKCKLITEIQKNVERKAQDPNYVLPTYISKPSRGFGG